MLILAEPVNKTTCIHPYASFSCKSDMGTVKLTAYRPGLFKAHVWVALISVSYIAVSQDCDAMSAAIQRPHCASWEQKACEAFTICVTYATTATTATHSGDK
jgi:hypothetical protein